MNKIKQLHVVVGLYNIMYNIVKYFTCFQNNKYVDTNKLHNIDFIEYQKSLVEVSHISDTEYY
jgi:hypothetical protein